VGLDPHLGGPTSWDRPPLKGAHVNGIGAPYRGVYLRGIGPLKRGSKFVGRNRDWEERLEHLSSPYINTSAAS
jgi:hypothetical protein